MAPLAELPARHPSGRCPLGAGGAVAAHHAQQYLRRLPAARPPGAALPGRGQALPPPVLQVRGGQLLELCSQPGPIPVRPFATRSLEGEGFGDGVPLAASCPSGWAGSLCAAPCCLLSPLPASPSLSHSADQLLALLPPPKTRMFCLFTASLPHNTPTTTRSEVGHQPCRSASSRGARAVLSSQGERVGSYKLLPNQGTRDQTSAALRLLPGCRSLPAAPVKSFHLAFPARMMRGVRSLLWTTGQEPASGQPASEDRKAEPQESYGRPHLTVRTAPD